MYELEASLASINVMVNISLVAILPSMGLGLTSTTLVGQALGRGDRQDASRWAWDVVRVSIIMTSALVTPMILFPRLVLSAFLARRQVGRDRGVAQAPTDLSGCQALD